MPAATRPAGDAGVGRREESRLESSTAVSSRCPTLASRGGFAAGRSLALLPESPNLRILVSFRAPIAVCQRDGATN